MTGRWRLWSPCFWFPLCSPLPPSAARSFCTCLIWVSYIWICNIISTQRHTIYMRQLITVQMNGTGRTRGSSHSSLTSSVFLLTACLDLSFFLALKGQLTCLFILSFGFTVSLVLLATEGHTPSTWSASAVCHTSHIDSLQVWDHH